MRSLQREGRLDEAEIAAFGAMLRAQRRWARIIVAVALAGLGAIALAASSGPRPSSRVAFERKADCLYDGCFCRGEHGLVQTACPPPESRECLPIADRCGE
ncbi:MAG TPA: hypothetical protein VLM85_02395 [Polyangiaceae bacterium]|nr:hypothetical protein [Polyangiaceae bacterium]